ncbi:glycosyltransferase family 4 protein [Selenomonas ruminantium]|nr:glycosyltransferase family 4 protein [Selenomonas ruminantium]
MGANRSMLELIDNLQKLGLKITVITNGYGELNSELDKRTIFNRSFDMYPWLMIKKGRNRILWPLKRCYYPYKNKKNIREIVACLQERNIDIIHTNNSVIDVGARVAANMHIPHVWHIREYGRYDYNLEFLYGDKYSISYMQENSAAIIFISQDLAKSYIERVSDITDFSVIFDGVALNNYSVKRDFSIYEDDVLNLVVCGLVTPHKNQIEVLQAISILPANVKKHLRCQIVGGGGKKYLSKLQAFCRDKEIADIVEFLGYRNDVPEILKKAHIAVMPSHREAFGRVTVEYMMAGLGVIASDTGANPEIIQDGVTGKIYHLGDINALAECIADFVNNRDKLVRIATTGHDNALVEFDSMNCAQKVLAIYRQINNED